MKAWRPLIVSCFMLASGAAFADAGETIALFNGKDFTGWAFCLTSRETDPATVWTVTDGVIRCAGEPAGYMRTEAEYANYRLSLQWRWPEGAGNSGLLLHIVGDDQVWPKSIESQLQSRHAGDFWVIGGADFKEHVNKDDRRVPKMHDHNEKTLGEWNTMEAVCEGGTIRIYVNGLLQNEATESTLTSGRIGLQSEGTSVEFRDITLTPLNPDTPE